MNAQTHTPGPWRAQSPRSAQHAIDRKWEIVAPLDSGELVIVGEHTGIDCLKESNARLIAAAPELLQALEDLRKELRAHVKFDVKKHYSLMVADVAADKAIHKARGA